jgi:predicted tellurium resistance membrane protein TerC
MISPRRFLLVLSLTLLAGWIVTGAVRSSPETPVTPAAMSTPVIVEGVRVQVEFPDESKTIKLDGEPMFATLRFKPHYGTVEFDTAKLKQILIEKVEGDTVKASVELIDGHMVHGQLLSTSLPLKDGAEIRQLPLKEGLKLKFYKPGEFGLLAAIIGLITLTLMEVILGIDNVIFLAIISGKLPTEQQPLARRIGLGAALGTRLLLLATLSFLLGLTKPIFELPEMTFFHEYEARSISWRDVILLAGGVFLIGKSTLEMHEKVKDAQKSEDSLSKKTAKFASVIVQIAIIDIVFSLDSVITAVGMVDQLWVMVTAMIIAVAIMLVFAEPISRFVEKYPTVKVLALSFLILIGVLLVAEGLGQHIDKGYIYFAMAFAVLVEFINTRLRP